MKITERILRQLIKKELLESKLITESQEVHVKKERGDYYVDSNFVNYSKLLPNSKLTHLGMGDFKLETKFGDIEFSRIRGDYNNFVGRAHKIMGDKSVIEKIVKELENISSVNVIQEIVLISEKSVNLRFRNTGDISFKVVESGATLVLIPSKTTDIDKVNSIIDNLNEEDFISLVINRLYDKTNIQFKRDRSYRGSGYGFIPDYKSYLR